MAFDNIERHAKNEVASCQAVRSPDQNPRRFRRADRAIDGGSSAITQPWPDRHTGTDGSMRRRQIGTGREKDIPSDREVMPMHLADLNRAEAARLREGAVRLVAIPGQRNAIAEIAAEAAIFRIAVHVRARQAPGRMASADAVEMDVTVHADTATRGQPTANRKAIKIGI